MLKSINNDGCLGKIHLQLLVRWIFFVPLQPSITTKKIIKYDARRSGYNGAE